MRRRTRGGLHGRRREELLQRGAGYNLYRGAAGRPRQWQERVRGPAAGLRRSSGFRRRAVRGGGGCGVERPSRRGDVEGGERWLPPARAYLQKHLGESAHGHRQHGQPVKASTSAARVAWAFVQVLP